MKERAYAFLGDLGIDFERFEHPPLFTCEDAKRFRPNADFLDVKNLFIRNRDKSNLYLVILPASKRADVNALRAALGESKLCFAEQDLLHERLKVSQGAVSILSLINLESPDVTVLIDKEVVEAARVGFHPNVNTETLVFAGGAIAKILDAAKVRSRVI
jgi:Ala-tRNA(Pro) deacylase